MGRVSTGLLFGVWILGAASAVGALYAYHATPGKAASVQPVVQKPFKVTQKVTAFLFLHPLCPCSPASLHAFERIATNHTGQGDFEVLFVIPPDADKSFYNTPLWNEAKTLTNLTVAEDRDGILAKKFGMQTSGTCLILDSHHSPLFSGGLTFGRGEEGDGPGSLAVEKLLRGEPNAPSTAPVYGCPLL